MGLSVKRGCCGSTLWCLHNCSEPGPGDWALGSLMGSRHVCPFWCGKVPRAGTCALCMQCFLPGVSPVVKPTSIVPRVCPSAGLKHQRSERGWAVTRWTSFAWTAPPVAEGGGEKEAWGSPAQCRYYGLCHHGLDSSSPHASVSMDR